MEGLLYFEASVVATTLTGEPNVVVACMVLAKLAYSRVLDDSLFMIFFGALCVTLVAKLFDWKTKTDNPLSNCLEAASVTIFSCILLPRLGINEDIRHWVLCGVYVLVTQKAEPSIILIGLYILNILFEPKEDIEYLSIVVYYTLFFGCFHISIWLWRKRDTLSNPLRFLRIRNNTTHTVANPSDNNHDHNE
jgi:hypothetical protein